MYENDYMYAIERNDDYLAHYGIKGMRWGVRKARALAGMKGTKALGRQYKKAAKKLERLEKRALSGKKYARRAAMLGAGAAAAGGLAALGTQGVGKIMRDSSQFAGKAHKATGGAISALGTGVNAVGRAIGSTGLRRAGASMVGTGNKIKSTSGATTKGLWDAGRAVSIWGTGHTAGKALSGAEFAAKTQAAKLAGSVGLNGTASSLSRNGGRTLRKQLRGIDNNTYARIAAGALGAGLAGAAGYNAYRAATTKRAAKKAAQWRSEMNKAFAGTQYANQVGKPRQGKKRRRG